MRVVRGLGGALLWIVASLLGVVAVLLCVTVILLPVGVPLLLLCRRLFSLATRMLLPRAMSHPVEEAGSSLRTKGRKTKKHAPDLAGDDLTKNVRKGLRWQRKKVRKRLRR